VVCGTARPQALLPPDSLGHLMYRLQLQRPQELRMVMSEVSLSRFEELLFGLARELRPTFAEGDPTMSRFDCSHCRDDCAAPLSIRFQIVAGGSSRD
jgi:hypothetical protein